jgi:hypothetical protein
MKDWLVAGSQAALLFVALALEALVQVMSIQVSRERRKDNRTCDGVGVDAADLP